MVLQITWMPIKSLRSENYQASETVNLPSYDRDKVEIDSTPFDDHMIEDKPARRQSQRLPSKDDDSYLCTQIYSLHRDQILELLLQVRNLHVSFSKDQMVLRLDLAPDTPNVRVISY